MTTCCFGVYIVNESMGRGRGDMGTEKRKIDIEIPIVREKALRQQLLTKVKRCHQDSTKQESCHLKPDAYIYSGI